MYKVIIVDDEQMIINSLTLGFDWEGHGYEVIATSTNSTDALHLIQVIRPDVVFTDIKMPILSGIELMQKTRENFPHIQFVIISGYTDFTYAQSALNLGASGYCLKPLEDEEIEAVLSNVTKHLEERQTVIQSAFNLLMYQPISSSARNLLNVLFSTEKSPEHLSIVLSLGDADTLFSRHTCYASIKLNQDCYLYMISANTEYLSSDLFHTTLLHLISEKRIRAISWIQTDNPVRSLVNDLQNLFDAVYSYFMLNPFTYTELPKEIKETSNEEFLQHISSLANNNQLKDISEILSHLKAACPTLKISEAVKLYNICTSLIFRITGIETIPAIHYPHELAQEFDNIDQMIDTIQEMIAGIIGRANPEIVNNESFRKILKYINMNFTSSLSFQAIADEYSINPSYLSQLFKKELGTTFTNYLTNLRIQYAKELLTTTTLRINEIPEKIGYRYDYNFAKLFKKETGLTPKEYRKQKQTLKGN